MQPCAVATIRPLLESFQIEVSESIFDPVWHPVVLAVGSNEVIRRSPAAPLTTFGHVPTISNSPFVAYNCRYQFLRIPAVTTTKVLGCSNACWHTNA